MITYKTDIFTGLRATSGITIGNLIGSIDQIVKLVESGEYGRPMVFVADMHSLTNNEAGDTQQYVIPVLKDCVAAGLDLDSLDIFVQSQIANEIGKMSLYLSRLITVAELMRVPTLKEKLKVNQSEENANALLLLYPVMMASDILLQKSMFVPVGKDQEAHLEVTCDLANRFNKRYGDILPLPKPIKQGESINILSLKGDGTKMSKSDPSGAIILDDDIDISLAKVKKAKTAFEGEMSDELSSLIEILEFVGSKEQIDEGKRIVGEHMDGKAVMGEFKGVLIDALEVFLKDFQSKKSSITDDSIMKHLKVGAQIARERAQETLKEVEDAMGMEFVGV